MTVVLSLSTTIRFARPRSERMAFSSFNPASSVMRRPPVRIAISSSIARRRSPNPGAFAAATFRTPRSLLTTRVARASPSMSSEITRSGLPTCETFSRIGRTSLIEAIFLSWIRMYASSRIASMRSGSVTKYGERYPRSNWSPSTTSSDVSRLFASSTVMTPSFPTLSIASEISLPISGSLFAEIVATLAISSGVLMGLDCFFSSATTACTARSMPRFRNIGLAPAVTSLSPE